MFHGHDWTDTILLFSRIPNEEKIEFLSPHPFPSLVRPNPEHQAIPISGSISTIPETLVIESSIKSVKNNNNKIEISLNINPFPFYFLSLSWEQKTPKAYLKEAEPRFNHRQEEKRWRSEEEGGWRRETERRLWDMINPPMVDSPSSTQAWRNSCSVKNSCSLRLKLWEQKRRESWWILQLQNRGQFKLWFMEWNY